MSVAQKRGALTARQHWANASGTLRSENVWLRITKNRPTHAGAGGAGSKIVRTRLASANPTESHIPHSPKVNWHNSLRKGKKWHFLSQSRTDLFSRSRRTTSANGASF